MPADTAPGLLAARLAADPGTPLVTFYDDASGERTELSAASFANWVAKTANLLVDGLGAAPGERAAVSLPLHWQSLAVVAGCWAAGLVVDLTAAPGARVAVAAEGGQLPDAEDAVLLSLRPLGAPLAVPAPPGVVDYAAEVPGHGDRFDGPGPVAGDLAAPAATHRELLSTAGGTPGERLLLAPDGDPPLGEALVRAAYLAPLAAGGSVVLVRHADPAGLARRAQVERASEPLRYLPRC